MHTTQPLRSTSGLRGRTVLRRNGQMRAAGAGYAAITSLWLILLLVSGPSAAFGIAEGLLGLLALTGIGLAVSRDNLIVDAAARTLILSKGIPGFTRETSYAFGDFDGIVVEESVFHRHEEETVCVAYSASFVNAASGERVRIWESDAEDSPEARTRLERQARRHAESIASATGLALRG